MRKILNFTVLAICLLVYNAYANSGVPVVYPAKKTECIKGSKDREFCHHYFGRTSVRFSFEVPPEISLTDCMRYYNSSN